MMLAAPQPIAFGDLPGWADDDHAAAFAAFLRSARRHLLLPYPARRYGVAAETLAQVAQQALAMPTDDEPATMRAEARAFFEACFMAHRLPAGDGATTGFATGFYEPVIAARLTPDAVHRFPIHAPPADLVEVAEGTPIAGMPAGTRFARRLGDGRLVAHHDRAAVEHGALEGQGPALAYAASRVDLFFAHVQGAARLDLGNGTMRRITYAAKSGHPFTGIGGVLTAMGELAPGTVTMATIRDWLGRHPHRLDEILHRNASYIYFRFSDPADHDGLAPDAGPIAAAKVALTPGRSIAVDRALHQFGLPFFVSIPGLQGEDGRPFRRLMIAQDTGSAITGPARVDLFAGSGAAAGEWAGQVRHPADIVLLVPR